MTNGEDDDEFDKTAHWVQSLAATREPFLDPFTPHVIMNDDAASFPNHDIAPSTLPRSRRNDPPHVHTLLARPLDTTGIPALPPDPVSRNDPYIFRPRAMQYSDSITYSPTVRQLQGLPVDRPIYPYAAEEADDWGQTTSNQDRLESVFKLNPTPSSVIRARLALQLGMSSRGVEVWFQHRRSKARVQEGRSAGAEASQTQDMPAFSSEAYATPRELLLAQPAEVRMPPDLSPSVVSPPSSDSDSSPSIPLGNRRSDALYVPTPFNSSLSDPRREHVQIVHAPGSPSSSPSSRSDVSSNPVIIDGSGASDAETSDFAPLQMISRHENSLPDVTVQSKAPYPGIHTHASGIPDSTTSTKVEHSDHSTSRPEHLEQLKLAFQGQGPTDAGASTNREVLRMPLKTEVEEEETPAPIPATHADKVALEAQHGLIADVDRTIEYCVRSLYPFQGEGPNYLAFEANLTLTANPSLRGGDWWHGTLVSSGKSGLFPKTCVEILRILKAKAAYSFTAGKVDHLSFKKGDRLIVIDMGKKGWWGVEHRGVVSLIPAAYVELVNAPNKSPRVRFQDAEETSTRDGVAIDAPLGMSPPPSASTPTSEHLTRSDRQDAPRTTASIVLPRLEAIFGNVTQYRRFLSFRDAEAQQLLDLFQWLLDTPELDAAFRRSLIVATQRLSQKTGLYPACYSLQGVEYGGDPVAAGSFADIYKGSLRGQPVCLKVIRVYQTTQVEYFLKTCSKEAILWGQLTHPNLLSIFGLYRLNNRICLVSAWMEHGDIAQYLANYPTVNRLLLVSDVTEGLSYLHLNKIIHGDMKGVNILISKLGRACLADFGLSSVSDANILAWTSNSSAASKGGSMRWQAPELFDLDNDEVVQNSEASDIYAWSCVCYEIFTGSVPFAHLSRESAVLLQVQAGRRPPRPPKSSPSWGAWGLTEDMWSLMQDCWHGEPAQRPTVQQVIVRLASKLPPDRRSVDSAERLSPAWFREKMRAPLDFPSILNTLEKVSKAQ